MSWLPPKGTADDLKLTLGQRQELLMECLALLFAEAWRTGDTVRAGEALRSPAQAAINAAGPDGRARIAMLLEDEFPTLAAAIKTQVGSGITISLHQEGLAMDLKLFRAGVYLTATSDYEQLGVYWESLHPLCRWGGRFNDGNHFSVTYQGIR